MPVQPHGSPWPSPDWTEGPIPHGVDLAPLLDAAFDAEGPLSFTYAVVVIHRGRLVAERYSGAIEHWDHEDEPVGPDTPLLSWSMAKSMLHAVVGILVGEGRLHLDAPAPVPEWAGASDPRRAITLQDLLDMRDGLDFAEASFPNNRARQSSLAKTRQLILRRDFGALPAYTVIGARSLAA